jgi:ribosome modulation factor
MKRGYQKGNGGILELFAEYSVLERRDSWVGLFRVFGS